MPDRFVLSMFEYGTLHGGEQSWLALVPSLRRRNIVFVAAAPHASPLAEQLKRADVVCLPLQIERERAPDDERLLQFVEQAIDDYSIDLVHANSLAMSRRLGRIAGRLSRPTVGHIRDIIKLSRKAVSDLNCNSRLIAVSEATRRFHVSQGLCEEKTDVCHNGVDGALFRPRRHPALRSEVGAPADAMIVLSVGQIGMRKGLDVSCTAIRRLCQSYENLYWLVVGERFSTKSEAVEYERQLRESAGELGARVKFLGVRTDVADIMASSDILLHAARQEPLGRVLLEGAASGLAIVATDVGGTPEIVEDGVSALLVPADHPESMEAALRRLIDQPTLRAQLGGAARRRVDLRFSIETAADCLATSFRSAVG